MITKIILDFVGVYSDKQPEENCIVLTNYKEGGNIFDVRSYKNDLEPQVSDYRRQINDIILDDNNCFRNLIKDNEWLIYGQVIAPINRWVECLKHFLDSYSIEEVCFMGYSKNRNIFLFEAEGEINKKLFYRSSYYIPSYIEQYLKDNFSGKLRIYKKESTSKLISYYILRNLLLTFFVLAKTLFYKLTTKKRNYTDNTQFNKVFLTRSIVQTEFIANYLKDDENSLLIVNEQSNRIGYQKKKLKDKKTPFIYAEGNVGFIFILKSLCTLISSLFKAKRDDKILLEIDGIKIQSKHLLPELINRELDFKFYSESVYNSIKKYLKMNWKVYSFEMMTSYPFYLKRNFHNKELFQIQTTLIEPIPNPNFIAGEKFYFTNPITEEAFIKSNYHLKLKIGCLPFLKYLNTIQKEKVKTLDSLLYVTQPIDIEEELDLVENLSIWCKKNNVSFFIKMHPRQGNRLKLNCQNINYITDYENSYDYMKKVDVVVTRNSSLGLDAWIYNVPIIFVRQNANIRNSKVFYIPDNYLGTVDSIQQMLDVLVRFRELSIDFYQHEMKRKLSAISNEDAEKILG